ncbi:MAG: type VI secretion system baseplate subunit TssG [Puniceicoccales bacterium]|jgi:type VI secretion system protein ImpH|nr:type VI secretion system baseplate subunit TssG [Puniceicoccales bacterium]
MSALKDSITALDFFRAVRLIDAEHPDLPRTGTASLPEQESIRFGQIPDLAFPLSALHSLEPETETSPPRLNLNFFGLLGPNGPLPLHLTEYIHDRLHNKRDSTIVAFLNIFHHRFASFFYRAWMINQLTLDLDRPSEQVYSFFIGSLLGTAADGVTPFGAADNNDLLPLNAKLFFSGRLSAQTRSVEGLETILNEFFEMPARLETNVGRWLPLPPENRLRLRGTRDGAARLGNTALIGSKTWDTQISFRIHLGPLDFSDYMRMLPDGDSFRRLREWIHCYAGVEYLWDVRLILKKTQVPRTQLGAGCGSRLGWTTWLYSMEPANDVSDLVIEPPDQLFDNDEVG